MHCSGLQPTRRRDTFMENHTSCTWHTCESAGAGVDARPHTCCRRIISDGKWQACSKSHTLTAAKNLMCVECQVRGAYGIETCRHADFGLQEWADAAHMHTRLHASLRRHDMRTSYYSRTGLANSMQGQPMQLHMRRACMQAGGHSLSHAGILKTLVRIL
jgi:hypothetical protein